MAQDEARVARPADVPVPAPALTPDGVLALQRQVGNAAVTRALIGRQPAPAVGAPAAAPLTDEQQWEQDWNTYSHLQHYFDSNDRPSGNKKFRYEYLCPHYKGQGVARPLKYIADNIVTASFAGHSTPAHKDLKAALKVAEQNLAKEGVVEAPFTKAWAFNPRMISGGGLSDHALGKAIDIDEVTNPRLANKAQRNVISAVAGMDMAAANPGAAAGMDSYDAAAAASAAFQKDYNAEGMARLIEEVTEFEEDQQEAIAALEGEKGALPAKARDRTDAQKAKAEELAKALKTEKAELKAATARRKTLQAARAKFVAVDAAIDDLEAKVETLTEEIAELTALVAAATKAKEEAEARKKAAKGNKAAERAEAELIRAKAKELTPLKGKLKTKGQALKKTRASLAKKEEAREGDTLRGYASRGILDLPKVLVESMKKAGLHWGGDWEGAKDFMHFEVP
ncbi:MAG: M15 family metallopeptidase [Actinomycetota bacterium]|nr:M15 family metallopeptidase [Actinomycetota bacterium]